HVDLLLRERLDEAVQRAVADAGDLALLAVDEEGDGDAVGAVARGLLAHVAQAVAAPAARLILRGQILVGERVPERLGADLAAVGVRLLLDDAGELDLEAARQVQAVLGPQQVGHAALPGLGVHADHGLVGAAEVLGVHGQVGDAPDDVVDLLAGLLRVDLHALQALLDRVLVRAGEGGEHEVAAVGAALGDGHLVAVLDGAAHLVEVGEVDLRVDALAEQVQAQGHEVHVAGPLAVAEQAALDTVGAGEVAELGRGDAGAAVVVGVQG